jgi:hypothetical protein
MPAEELLRFIESDDAFSTLLLHIGQFSDGTLRHTKQSPVGIPHLSNISFRNSFWIKSFRELI